jgi:hypothetical protein
MANQAVMRSVEKVLGHPAQDAVLIVHRKRWALPASFIVFVVLYFALNAVKRSVFSAGLAGGCTGLTLVLAQQYRFLARSGSRLLLLSSNRWFARATSVIREVQPDEVVTVKSPGVNKTITIDNTRYVVSRLFTSRLEKLLGRPL